MEKEFVFSLLNNIYGDLLTEKQKEVIELYYGCDLSLAEIAEIKNTSRNSVLDLIESAKKKLLKYENSLQFYAKRQQIYKLLEQEYTFFAKKIIEILEK